MITTLVRSLQEGFGIPSSLHHVLQTHLELRVELNAPQFDIAASSVVQWHNWADQTRWQLRGWWHDGSEYSAFPVNHSLFADFTTCDVTEGWECDIQDVNGLWSSRSDLTSFTTLDAMVETDAKEMIAPMSRDQLLKNLAWKQIRILHGNDNSDYFARYGWDNRLFLMNDGGSHHFAAARYIAARLAVPVPVAGNLRTYRLNGLKVSSLRKEFELFAISGNPTASNAFFEAMRRFRATYISTPLPRPFEDCLALLLPKTEERSVKVAAAFRDAGYVDLGRYFQQLLARQ